MTIRVFILDDHEIVRRGLRELFEREDDIEVVGESGFGSRSNSQDSGASSRCRAVGCAAARWVGHRYLSRHSFR